VHLLLTTVEAARRFKDTLQVKKQQAHGNNSIIKINKIANQFNFFLPSHSDIRSIRKRIETLP
jgi:hypothetical protein